MGRRLDEIARGKLPPDTSLGNMVSDARRLADASRATASHLSGKPEAVLESITGIKIGSTSIAKAGLLLTRDISDSASAAEELGASASSLADLAVRQSAVVVQSSAAIEQMSASAANIARVVADRKKANHELAIKSRDSAAAATSISQVIDEFATRAA
jgi:methyl-accepting chemotaxis protein